MTSKKIDPLGAQPTDPPWARLAFLLVQGREGQWWRAILLIASLLFLLIALTVTVNIVAQWSFGHAVDIEFLMTSGVFTVYLWRRSRGTRF